MIKAIFYFTIISAFLLFFLYIVGLEQPQKQSLSNSENPSNSENLSNSKNLSNSPSKQEQVDVCAPELEKLTQELTTSSHQYQKQKVPEIIAAFRSGERSCISQVMIYPFETPYPLEPINSAKEMLLRFDEVFDQQLINKIAKSTVSDWKSVGWRGVMLNNGEIWAGESSFIHKINTQTIQHKAVMQATLDERRYFIHPSLREFNSAVLSWNSSRFNVRVDYMGESEYRYAVWPGHKSQDMAPDMILLGGEKSWVGGTLRYPKYTFKNGQYLYKVESGWSPDWPDGKIGFLQVTKAVNGKPDKELVLVDFYEDEAGLDLPIQKVSKRINFAKAFIKRLIEKKPLTDLLNHNIDVRYIYTGNEDAHPSYYEKAINVSVENIPLNNLIDSLNNAASSNIFWFLKEWDLVNVKILKTLAPLRETKHTKDIKNEGNQLYITDSGENIHYFILNFADENGEDKLKSITVFFAYLP